MGSSSKSQITGYRYFMGLHFGVCYGPIDRFRRLIVGDRTAWSGEQTTSGAVTVNAPNLFGGDEREGGIAGALQVMMGEQTQTLPSAVSSLLPSIAPAFRGVFSLFYNGQITANNPYIKPFAFKLQRTLAGWAGGSPWYPEKCEIGAVGAGGAAKTLLQSRFAEASAADESAYARGNPSGTAVTLYDGYAHVFKVIGDGSHPPVQLVYPAVTPNGTDALTFEMIVSWLSVPDVYYTVIAEISGGSGYDRFGYTTSAGRIVFDDFGTSGPQYKATNPPGTSPVHLAIVYSATGTRVYVAGQKVYELLTPHIPSASTPLTVKIGDPGVSDGLTSFKVHGFRLRQAEVYTGASFVPPTSIPDPDANGDSVGNVLMNPAHIIYQCVTDPSWGMGYPVASIDDAAFRAAADTLYAENFGLCMLWSKQEEIGNFIRNVLDHIGGVFYVDPKTGKFALRLLRADYDPDALDVFDESNIVELQSFQRVGYGDTVNEITVVYRDVETNKDSPVTVQNLANITAQGGVVSQTRNYPGLPNSALALRVAQRDLIAASTPLSKGRFTVNRKAWARFPGDVIKLTWPKLGIVSLICRVLAVDYGRLDDGTITVEFAEDVFGMPSASYAAQEPSGWSESTNVPQKVVAEDVVEVPYRTLATYLSAADFSSIVDASSAFFAIVAARPQSIALSFDIYSKTGAETFKRRASGAFVPYAKLAGAMTATTTAITLAAGVDLGLVKTGTLAIIGTGQAAEWVRVDAIDATAGTATVARGMLDTVPMPHAADAPVFFDDAHSATENVERATSEVVDFKLSTVTPGGMLAIAGADLMTATAAQRQNLPYAPGNFKINGAAYPATVSGPLTITWSHRNRLQQLADLITQDAGNIGPEDGVTYHVELMNATTGAQISSALNITGTSHVPELTQSGTYQCRVRVWARRGGLPCWQPQDHTFTHTYTGTVSSPSGGGGGTAALTATASLFWPTPNGVITLAQTQTAQGVRAAGSWNSRLSAAYRGAAATTVVQQGSVLSAQFVRFYTVGAQVYGDSTSISFAVPAPYSIDQALAGFALLVNANTTLHAAGWNANVIGAGSSAYIELIGPYDADWEVWEYPPATDPPSAWWGFMQTVTTPGGSAITTGRPQVITATLSGAYNPGEMFTLRLGSEVFNYIAPAGSTLSTVAYGLAGVVDASPNYIASASGAVITITGAANTSFLGVASVTTPKAYGDFDAAAPDPHYSNVKALLHFDGTAGSQTLTDNSGASPTITVVGSGALDTSFAAKWGSASWKGATGSYFQVAIAGTFTGDFTVEWWGGATTSSECTFYCVEAGSYLYNGNFQGYGGPALALNTTTGGGWSHFAICRQGSTMRAYKDGVQVGTATYSGTVDMRTTRWGVYVPNGNLHNTHNIDDLRITAAVCRYINGTTFTPPQAAFPNY